MLSCRSFYSPELEFCRRSERGGPLQLAHAGRHREQYDTGDGLGNRTSSLSDSDDKFSSIPRRRVPVACARCRRRKIKCSGDDGYSACSNCRNSGTVHQCQFLRVNSLSQEILSHPHSRWHMGVRYSPYPMNLHGARHNSIAVSHPYGTSGSYSTIPPASEYNAYTGTPQGTSWVGNNTGGVYSYSCDEEATPNPPSHPVYLHPNVESTTNSIGSVGPPTGSRTWVPTKQMNRAQHSIAYAEQPVTSSIAPMGFQFASYSPEQTTMASESAFPGLLNANTSMMTNDRVLPDPAASRTQAATKITSIESVLMNPLQRPSSTWIEGMPGSSHSGTSRTLSIVLSDGSDSTARSATSSAPQDMGFGFIPISNSPQAGSIQSSAMVTAAETSQSGIECPRAPLADHSKDRCRTLSRESIASPHEEAVAEAYGYSSENRSIRHSVYSNTSSGQLSNGQEYTRLRHEASHVNLTLDKHQQNNSSVYQTNLLRQVSVASND